MYPESDLENHRLNYRIAFDAMRAYHNSEIEHKKDMISILNSFFLSIITVFTGIFVFLLKEYTSVYFSLSIITIPAIMLIYIVLIVRLKSSNKGKIIADNKRYEKFRLECIAERKHLGLTAFFETNHPFDSLYWRERFGDEGEGLGFLETIAIINIYGNLLIGIVTALSVISLLMLLLKTELISF